MSLSRGRDLVAIPGPSIMPDRVLRAMHRPAPDIYGEELIDLTHGVLRDLKRVAGTEGHAVIYLGNGHAAWEAALANLLAAGDKALVLATGRFGHGWAAMARQMGIEVEVMDFGFRQAVRDQRLVERLRSDRGHEIRAVLTVQTDTATSVRNDIPGIRAALDAAGHPALLVVDCIASLACERFEMDAFGVDVMLAACQKGLMTPPGLAFTFHNARAAAAAVPCRSPYWDWTPRVQPEVFYHLFCGTAPTHHLYGLREALDMILEEEGLAAVWERHARFAEAVWAAFEAWGDGGDMELNVPVAAERSHAVTTIRTAPGQAPRLRAWCAEQGLTLGVALTGPEERDDALFRIGHMGHLNPPMLLGALATVEAGLGATGLPHGPGGVAAAAARIGGAVHGGRSFAAMEQSLAPAR